MTSHCPCGSGQAIETDGKCGQCRQTTTAVPLDLTSASYVHVHDWPSSVTISRAVNGYIVTHRGQTYVYQSFDAVTTLLRELYGVTP